MKIDAGQARDIYKRVFGEALQAPLLKHRISQVKHRRERGRESAQTPPSSLIKTLLGNKSKNNIVSLSAYHFN